MLIQKLIWDITIVDTLADSYVLKTSEVSGFLKWVANANIANMYRSNYIFKAFETLGSWCKETIDFINVIGNRLSRNQAIQNKRNSFLK
jgi:hypothetical protein